MGRVVASSANWEELKPWGTLAGFRWSLIPAVESHTGGNTTLGKTYVMYHLGKESETVEARVAVDGRGVTMSGRALGRFRGGGRVGKRLSAHFAHTRRTPLGTPGEFCTLPDKYKFRAHFAPGASAHIHCLFKQAKSKLPDLT